MLDLAPRRPGMLLFRPPQTAGHHPARLAYAAARGDGTRDTVAVPPASRVVHCAAWNHPSFDAAAECWEHGLDLAISRGARVVALLPAIAHAGNARIAHRARLYRRQRDPHWCRDIVRDIVQAKLHNQSALLILYHDRPAQAWEQRGLPPTPWGEDYTAAIAGLRADRLALRAANDLASIRGLEGHGARHYFSAWPALTRRDSFRRSPRTQRDPVNLLLDRCYAHLAHRFTLHLLDHDLDCAAGMLHADDDHRPGLALDLMEPVRPLIADRFALRWLRRPPRDWWRTTAEGRLTFTATGNRLFRQRWGDWLTGTSRRSGQDRHIAAIVSGFRDWIDTGTPLSWPRIR